MPSTRNRRSASRSWPENEIPDSTFKVKKRSGSACTVCKLRVSALIDAAHVIPVKDGGSNHPANGIPLCATHHRAFDAGLFTIHPDTLNVLLQGNLSLEELKISVESIEWLEAAPNHTLLPGTSRTPRRAKPQCFCDPNHWRVTSDHQVPRLRGSPVQHVPSRPGTDEGQRQKNSRNRRCGSDSSFSSFPWTSVIAISDSVLPAG